jgi:hypothetical protein
LWGNRYVPEAITMSSIRMVTTQKASPAPKVSTGDIVKPLIGKLKGFTKRWNPFENEIFALVEVDDRQVINVPIDYRQQKYIQSEHPVNSMVPVIFREGRWQISSKTIAADPVMLGDNHTFA